MASVAPNWTQDDIHPLLRHPRPIKRDSVKAQHMLGLIADSEERLTGLQREKSVTTRWLERPMNGNLDTSDVDSETEEPVQERFDEKTYEGELAKVISNSKFSAQSLPRDNVAKEEDDADLLDKWTNPERPTSINPEVKQLLTSTDVNQEFNVVKKRPDPLRLPRPISYNSQHLLSPEWTTSPVTLSPYNSGQRPTSAYLTSPSLAGSSISSPGSVYEYKAHTTHSQTWPSPPMHHKHNTKAQRPISYHTENSTPLGSPSEQRQRPISFAAYHQRNRSSTKIASSRGLRNNSYPNYSRPVSTSAPKSVPGEYMENDMVYSRFVEDEVGPPTPTSPTIETSPGRRTVPVRDEFAGFEIRDDKDKTEKKSRNRWSSIPQLVKKVAARRKSSAASQQLPSFEVQEMQQHDAGREDLTEENLHRYGREASSQRNTPRSRFSKTQLIPTPTYSPFDVVQHQPVQKSPNSSSNGLIPLPMPFAPWADGPPSPAASAEHQRRNSGASLSPTRTTRSSRLSAEIISQSRPSSTYSQRSSMLFTSSSGATNPTFAVSEYSHPASRRGTPVPDPTCIMCKTSKPTFEFAEKRITENCWHEPATCVECLQAWVHQCVHTKGWDRCTCPECGEVMTRSNVTEIIEMTARLR